MAGKTHRVVAYKSESRMHPILSKVWDWNFPAYSHILDECWSYIGNASDCELQGDWPDDSFYATDPYSCTQGDCPNGWNGWNGWNALWGTNTIPERKNQVCLEKYEDWHKQASGQVFIERHVKQLSLISETLHLEHCITKFVIETFCHPCYSLTIFLHICCFQSFHSTWV